MPCAVKYSTGVTRDANPPPAPATNLVAINTRNPNTIAKPSMAAIAPHRRLPRFQSSKARNTGKVTHSSFASSATAKTATAGQIRSRNHSHKTNRHNTVDNAEDLAKT